MIRNEVLTLAYSVSTSPITAPGLVRNDRGVHHAVQTTGDHKPHPHSEP